MRRDRRFVALTTTVPDHLRRPNLRLSVDTAVDLAFMRQLFAAVEDGTARHVPLADLIRAAGRLLASQ
jgi:spore coat polysaccharide biosynthesis protein SpsF (cytidylyltransferase family)